MTDTPHQSSHSPPAVGTPPAGDGRWLSGLEESPTLAWLLPLFLLTALGLLTEFLWQEHTLRTASETRQTLLRNAGALRSILESELNATAYLANGLEYYIIGNKGKISHNEIEPLLATVFARSPHFRNIGIAPNNRLTYVYPLSGNEKALGMYYPNNPDQWPLIESIIASGKGRLVGPLELVQGGKSLIFRIPVFIEGHYWGLISTVFDAEKLLHTHSPLDKSLSYRLALRGKDALGAAGEMIYGDAALFNDDNVRMEIAVPGGSWQLALASSAPADSKQSWRITGWLCSLLLAAMVHWLVVLLRREQDRNTTQGRMLIALHQAEQEIAKHRDLLESEVEQRTFELQQSNHDLRQAKEAAETAYHARSAFVANISHEIRTPLHAVIGLTHILQRRAPRQDQQECLSNILSSAQHLLRLLNDILDLSRIEANKLPIVSAPFSSADLAQQVQSMFAEQATSKGLAFTVDFSTLPENLAGDIARLRQILVNLIGNALKFTDTGQIEVTADSQPLPHGEILVRFNIADSGIGLTKDQLERIFDAFEQADASSTRRFGGSGLGLAISRRLAELMGGECQAESQPGTGSVFWFTARLQQTATSREQ